MHFGLKSLSLKNLCICFNGMALICITPWRIAILRLFDSFSGIFNWFDFNMFSHSSLILDLIILYCFIPFLLSINLFKITPSSMKFLVSLSQISFIVFSVL